MTMRHARTWLLIAAALGLSCVVAWWQRPAPQVLPSRVDAAVASDAPLPRRAAMIGSTLPDAFSSMDALPVAVVDGGGLGGRDLRLTESLDAAIAAHGADAWLVYDMEAYAFMACGIAKRLTDQPERLDPNRAWAIDYVLRACTGYDEKKYTPFLRGMAPDLIFAREMGEPIADALALDDLRTAVTSAQLTPASNQLFRSGKFPVAIPQHLSDGERMEAFELAVVPIRCRALNACGNQSLLTAMLCMQGCARGVTLEQAMRSRMSPAAIAAAMEMRRGIVRFRSAPR